MWRAMLLAVVACSGAPRGGGTPGNGMGDRGSADGSAGTEPVAGGGRTCVDVQARVEELYRAEAQQKEPKRVADAVADNTTMVMNDCAKEPGRIVPCIASASSVAQLEKQCLIQLDDDGTEGEALAR